MALPHVSSGQALDIRPLGHRLLTERTSALFKSLDLEVMRVVLLTGRSLPTHQVPGEVTIHCLEGTLDIELKNSTERLEMGELLFLKRGETHAIKAVSDACALVTIALRP